MTLCNIRISTLRLFPLSLATYPRTRIATNWIVGSTQIVRRLCHLLPRAVPWATADFMAITKVSAVVMGMDHQVVVQTVAATTRTKTVDTAMAPRRIEDLRGLETEIATIHPLILDYRPGPRHLKMAGILIMIGTIGTDHLYLTDEVPHPADQTLIRIFPATEWEEETRGHLETVETTVLHETTVGEGTILTIAGLQSGTVSATA